MQEIYSILNLARLALDAERLSVSVAAENIAGMNVSGYVPKQFNKSEFLNLITNDSSVKSSSNQDLTSLVEENNSKVIKLDREVFDINNAQMRYEAVAQMMNRKLGLIELVAKGRSQ